MWEGWREEYRVEGGVCVGREVEGGVCMWGGWKEECVGREVEGGMCGGEVEGGV